MATIGEVYQALQAIGQAVTNNDEPAFRAAVEHAKSIDCTPEQIRDAYDYRNSIRALGYVSFPFEQ